MGIIVSLSGVDGSGKTTIAKLVIERLMNCGVNAKYHHELDFILLRAFIGISKNFIGSGKSNNVREKTITMIDEGEYNWRYFYYLFILFHSLLTYAYYKIGKGMIVYDRWIYELTTIFDHKQIDNMVLRKLYLGFPRPDIMILLTAPPRLARFRKRDDPGHATHGLDYYVTMQERMRKLAIHVNCDAILSTDRSKEVIVEEVFNLIMARIRDNTFLKSAEDNLRTQ